MADMELRDIFRLFFDGEPVALETIDTSHGDSDFRVVVMAEDAAGGKYVIKLADNDFTFPDKIEMWKRTVGEYRRLGYYCPAIFHDKAGRFPTVSYQGHRCVAYAEEHAPYQPAQQRITEASDQDEPLADGVERDMWIMTAKMAAQHLDYTGYPSGYCLFETFCPSDQTDEVLENALDWKAYAETLPDELQEQVKRIWRLWTENRKALEPVYRMLPASVLQADLNPSNVLLDDSGKFVGVYDFNLCGKEVFLNYLFRENFAADFAQELEMIRRTLETVSRYYHFSDLEKSAALMLYRCLKPLWFNKLQKLKGLKGNVAAVAAYLDETEQYLTQEINFSQWMI